MTEAVQREDGRDEWATPEAAYKAICERWQLQPTLDVCASADNTKCASFITAQENALDRHWGSAEVLRGFPYLKLTSAVCWMNPPYSQPLMTRFIEKAIEQSKYGAITVFLLPSNVDQKWYHELIKPYPHEFWQGRIKFEPPPGIKPSSPRYGNIHGVISGVTTCPVEY